MPDVVTNPQLECPICHCKLMLGEYRLTWPFTESGLLAFGYWLRDRLLDHVRESHRLSEDGFWARLLLLKEQERENRE